MIRKVGEKDKPQNLYFYLTHITFIFNEYHPVLQICMYVYKENVSTCTNCIVEHNESIAMGNENSKNIKHGKCNNFSLLYNNVM